MVDPESVRHEGKDFPTWDAYPAHGAVCHVLRLLTRQAAAQDHDDGV